MTRIGFVLPPDVKNHSPFRNHPLTQFHLATILEDRLGGAVECRFIDLRGVRQECVRQYIPECDGYFYTIMSPEFPAVESVARVIRELYPKALHVAGGPHVNLFPEASQEVFDAVVVGEGDHLVLDIVKDIRGKTLRPLYKPAAAVDINEFPYPRRHYLPKPAVVDTGLMAGEHASLPATSVLFSRGCPFKCHFCANVTLGPTRYRSPANIESEITYLKESFGVRGLAVKDDNGIPLDKRVAAPYLETLARCGIKWRGQSRGNGIGEDMVRLAQQSGCTDLGIGIESVSQKVLDAINKKLDLDEAQKYIELLHKYGIGARVHLIVGLPGEPDDIVEQTIAFIRSARPSSVLLSLFCPIPGSYISQHPEAFGMQLLVKDLADLRSVFARFDPDEEPYALFRYDDVTPQGKGMPVSTIIENYMAIQAYCRENNLVF